MLAGFGVDGDVLLSVCEPADGSLMVAVGSPKTRFAAGVQESTEHWVSILPGVRYAHAPSLRVAHFSFLAEVASNPAPLQGLGMAHMAARDRADTGGAGDEYMAIGVWAAPTRLSFYHAAAGERRGAGWLTARAVGGAPELVVGLAPATLREAAEAAGLVFTLHTPRGGGGAKRRRLEVAEVSVRLPANAFDVEAAVAAFLMDECSGLRPTNCLRDFAADRVCSWGGILASAGVGRGGIAGERPFYGSGSSLCRFTGETGALMVIIMLLNPLAPVVDKLPATNRLGLLVHVAAADGRSRIQRVLIFKPAPSSEEVSAAEVREVTAKLAAAEVDSRPQAAAALPLLVTNVSVFSFASVTRLYHATLPQVLGGFCRPP